MFLNGHMFTFTDSKLGRLSHKTQKIPLMFKLSKTKSHFFHIKKNTLKPKSAFALFFRKT